MAYPPVRRPEPRRRDLVLTALLLFGSWMLARVGPPGQMQIATTLRSTVLSPFLAVHAAVAERRVLARRVETLEAERDSLARRLLELAGAADENGRLRLLLGLPARAVPGFVITELVPGRPVVGESHTFLLRAGAEAGVRPPVGVFTHRGLVGVVRSAGPRTAIGEFWTHPEFAVSVRTEDGAATGIVRAAGDGARAVMRLDGAPYQADIRPGTRLLTAGVGGIHPPGVPVGTVRGTEATGESGWERSYLVEPTVRPEQTGVVLVWRRPADDAGGGGPAATEATPPGPPPDAPPGGGR